MSRQFMSRRSAIKLLAACGTGIGGFVAGWVPELAFASSARPGSRISTTAMGGAEAEALFQQASADAAVSALQAFLQARQYTEDHVGAAGSVITSPGSAAGRLVTRSYRTSDQRRAALFVAIPDAGQLTAVLHEYSAQGSVSQLDGWRFDSLSQSVGTFGTVTRIGQELTVRDVRTGAVRRTSLTGSPLPARSPIGVQRVEASTGCDVCVAGAALLLGLPCFLGSLALCAAACAEVAEVCAVPCGVLFYFLCGVQGTAGALDLCYWMGACP